MEKITKHIKITEEDILNCKEDTWFVLEPMWQKGNIYDTYVVYEESLSNFTLPQKYLHAVEWLIAEVNNGGFDQFFSNSTGIVWKNACKGFEAMGYKEAVSLLEKIEKLYGKKPNEDREKRWEEMEQNKNWDEDIDDLNSVFYSLEELDDIILNYVKSNAKDFTFDGTIEIIK